MEGASQGQGAANLLGLWREKEGYTPDGPFLILSGGDNWTGPAISTWFQGAEHGRGDERHGLCRLGGRQP